jgi:hypothetical protein
MIINYLMKERTPTLAIHFKIGVETKPHISRGYVQDSSKLSHVSECAAARFDLGGHQLSSRGRSHVPTVLTCSRSGNTTMSYLLLLYAVSIFHMKSRIE